MTTKKPAAKKSSTPAKKAATTAKKKSSAAPAKKKPAAPAKKAAAPARKKPAATAPAKVAATSTKPADKGSAKAFWAKKKQAFSDAAEAAALPPPPPRGVTITVMKKPAAVVDADGLDAPVTADVDAAVIAAATPAAPARETRAKSTPATPARAHDDVRPPPPRPEPLAPRRVVVAGEVDLSDHGVVHLLPKKDRPARRRHPWIFSGAIGRVVGEPEGGDVVVVVDSSGEVVGRGAYSPTSQIRVRLWSFDDTPVNEAFIVDKLKAATALRDQLVLSKKVDDVTDGARMVFGEGDGLPGLIVDAYADTIVMQCQSAGAERIKPIVVAFFVARGAARVVERGDADVRQKEGLPSIKGLLAGTPVDGPVVTLEHGMRFHVDVEGGHKTGFYLDQRDSRQALREVSRGKRVLNCFCYTGGFSIAALKGGASHVTSVDTSLAALELGEKNAIDNGFADDKHEWLKGDCFDVLRGLNDDGERFDVVILDPPKFAPSAAHLERASRGYRDLMIRGMRLLAPGGLLFTFSCSGAVDRALFRDLAAQAALEVGRPAQMLAELGHSRCHPVPLSFPEGEYLKGLLLAVR